MDSCWITKGFRDRDVILLATGIYIFQVGEEFFLRLLAYMCVMSSIITYAQNPIDAVGGFLPKLNSVAYSSGN